MLVHMKSLLIMRHAKSDWSSPTGGDFDRPLADRGNLAADAMGRHLAQYRVDMILSSPAMRAKTTAQRVREAAGWTMDILTDAALYDSTPAIVMNQIRATPDAVSTLLITGHEPTWSYLVATLTAEKHLEFPTAAVACVELESWSVIGPGTAALRWYITPRDLKE